MTLVARSAARPAGLGMLFLIAWLLLAAMPVLADGGPHIADINNGSTTLTTDSCAGCHRAHTAQGAMLLKVPEEELCASCHGDEGTGARTDVWSGVQYALGVDGDRNESVEIGALRGGGFEQARIASGSPARVFQTGNAIFVRSKVSVGAPGAVTSAHLNLPANGLSAPTVAWGNGAIPAGTPVGPTTTISCGSCHNVHGNDRYRILKPVPGDGDGPIIEVPEPGASVSDAVVLPPAGDARNYTVLQVRPGQVAGGTYMLLASDVLDARRQWDGDPTTVNTKNWPSGDYSAAGGDYWHVRVPWNNATGTADTPNGLAGFNDQMDNWCTACHTRYQGGTTDYLDPTGDPVYAHRHQTGGRTTCTTCHVAHGSNAMMDAVPDDPLDPDTLGPQGYAGNFPYPVAPGGTAILSDSSRLLKVDNRGTCQLCHDPTGTVTAGTYTGPPTVPGVP